jgi:hypothetical protein
MKEGKAAGLYCMECAVAAEQTDDVLLLFRLFPLRSVVSSFFFFLSSSHLLTQKVWG